MSGTVEGGKRAAQTNKLRHGNSFYRTIGRRGGSVKGVAKGFALDKELARAAGAKGGRNSKRTGVFKQPLGWAEAVDMDISIADSIAMERGKSWRERFFGR